MKSRNSLKNIANKSEDIGNKAYNRFKRSHKLKHAMVAVRAYNTALRAKYLEIIDKDY